MLLLFDQVASYLDDPDWLVRKTAAHYLGEMGKGAAQHAKAVAVLLTDKTTHCRKEAVIALAKMGETADTHLGLNAVVGRLIGNKFGSCDTSPIVRKAALTHLPSMGY